MTNFLVIFLFIICVLLSLIYLNLNHQKNIIERSLKINDSFVLSSLLLKNNGNSDIQWNTSIETQKQRLFDISTPSPAVVQMISDYYDKVIVEMKDYLLYSKVNLKSKLFPWLIGIEQSWNRSSYVGQKQSKGIVICSGNRHIRWTLVALKCLEMIENDLPIEVMYFTSKDLSVDNQELMRKSFPNVYLTDLSLSYANDSHLDLHGRQMQSFAVLACRFEQVVLMDSDVLFVEKPSILFGNVNFVRNGYLFFYDRCEVSNETKRWIESFSTKKNQSMIPERRQESSVIVIDKYRVLKGILSTCKLNDHQGQEQRDAYKYLYNDRDTWWLGFSIVEISSSFMSSLTGVIGKIDDENKERVFGNVLHFDEYYEPIWWNGGMFRNGDVNDELLEMNGWLEEGQW
ncbi:unnamed protein product, partial [Adineta ricciae]